MNIYSNIFSQDKKFYVYQYIRSKKSKHGNIGSPYYIGKGIKKRIYSCQHNARPPKDTSFIQISTAMTEADAFQAEILLIHLYGRIDISTGCLRNRTNGGDGASGAIRYIETKKLMSDSQKGKHNHKGSSNPMFGKNHSSKVREAAKLRQIKTNSKRKWYNNGIETKFLQKCPIGWKRGRLYQKPTTKGNKWFNNGLIQCCCQKKPTGDNWINGMLPKRILGIELRPKPLNCR